MSALEEKADSAIRFDGSMAPGFETEEALKRSKAQADYWAKQAPKP